MEAKEEVKKISVLLREYQRAYYVDGKALVPDSEYDRLFDRLSELEKEDPSLVLPDSPTQRVGSDLSADFPEVEHTIPVLSLDKAYSAEVVLSWMAKSEEKAKGNLSFVVEEKIDGVSMVLYYEEGLLVRAVTRGNGFVGNDVTANIKTIASVPLRLSSPVDIAVRGEVYLPKAAFQALKDAQPDLERQYANTRNLTAGTVRRQKSSEAAEIPLQIFVYEGFWTDKDQTPKDHLHILSELRRLGFRTNEHIGFFCQSKEAAARELASVNIPGEAHAFADLGDYLAMATVRRPHLGYDIDGMVTKVNELDVREAFGYTEHHPRWAIAYKFESPQADTKVLGITIQVGRTGRITPVAELKSVALGGSVVSRATLHNQEYIDELELAIGDEVSVSKRGDVIPAVEEVLDKNSEGNTTYEIPSTCPCCHTSLVKRGAHLFCPNKTCPDQVKARLAFFAGRDQMDIETLGPKTIEMLLSADLIKDIPDIYTCDYTRLIGTKGVGDKMVSSLIEGVKASLAQPYSVVLTSLGIPELGKKAVEVLIKAGFDDVDKLFAVAKAGKEESLTAIPQIGPQTAHLIIEYFSDPEHIAQIERLRSLGLHFKAEAEVNDCKQVFAGQVWCATGSLEHFNPRSKALKEVEKRGGRTTSSVTSKTTHLLCGSGGGSKRADAERLGVKLVDEQEFLALLGVEGEKADEGERDLQPSFF